VKLCYRITTRSSEADHSLAEARHADRSREAEAADGAAGEDAAQAVGLDVGHHAVPAHETVGLKCNAWAHHEGKDARTLSLKA